MTRTALALVALVTLCLGLAGCSPGREVASGTALTPEDAREVLADRDPFQRYVRWSALLGTAPPDALPVLKGAVSESSLDIGDQEIVTFAMWWAHFAPKDALAWTRSEWRAEPQIVVGAIFRVWGSADPEAAFKAADGIGEFYENAAFDGVISGWHDSGKPGLVEGVQAILDDAKRQRVSESLARRIVLGQGTDAALEWVSAIQDPVFRDTMTMRVTSTAAAQGDAAKIAAWASPQVGSGMDQVSGFPRRIGTRWILRDPPAALAWLKSLPDGRDRDDGVTEAFRDWLNYTPGAAMKWAQETPMETWNEPALAIYARAMAKGSPREAIELAMRFADLDRRYLTVTVIARAWAMKDLKAAHAWVDQADLPPDVKERAKMQLRQRPQAAQPASLAP